MCAHAQLCQILLWSHGLAQQVSLSMRFPRQEYWSGLPFPTLWDLPDPGIKLGSPASPSLAGGFFTASATKALLDSQWAAAALHPDHMLPFLLTCLTASQGISLCPDNFSPLKHALTPPQQSPGVPAYALFCFTNKSGKTPTPHSGHPACQQDQKSLCSESGEREDSASLCRP